MAFKKCFSLLNLSNRQPPGPDQHFNLFQFAKYQIISLLTFHFIINRSPPQINPTTKVVTSWSYDNGRKMKKVSTFKIEKKLVPKAVAARKALPKFGGSRGDRPGPNPATTIVSADEIDMVFTYNKDENEKEEGEKSALDVLKSQSKGVVKCRICKEDHWTTNCPYKDTLGPLRYG